MERKQKNFLEPGYSFIVVRESTSLVIRKTLEEFAVDRENDFWLKLYYLIVELDINDLNTMLELQNKRIKEEQEEQRD